MPSWRSSRTPIEEIPEQPPAATAPTNGVRGGEARSARRGASAPSAAQRSACRKRGLAPRPGSRPARPRPAGGGHREGGAVAVAVAVAEVVAVRGGAYRTLHYASARSSGGKHGRLEACTADMGGCA